MSNLDVEGNIAISEDVFAHRVEGLSSLLDAAHDIKCIVERGCEVAAEVFKLLAERYVSIFVDENVGDFFGRWFYSWWRHVHGFSLGFSLGLFTPGMDGKPKSLEVCDDQCGGSLGVGAVEEEEGCVINVAGLEEGKGRLKVSLISSRKLKFVVAFDFSLTAARLGAVA